MVNTKYYLILLTGVFLSLGIGIAVGISLQSKDILEKQHGVLVQRLEEEFAGIRNENRQLKETLSIIEESEMKNRELYESMFNAVVRNKLNGLKVALIETGEDSDLSSLISILKVSGASIESNITFRSNLFKEDQELVEAIKIFDQREVGSDQLHSELAQELMDSLIVGSYSPLIKRLNELNLIHSSVELQSSCDAIVIAYSSISANRKAKIDRFTNSFIRLSMESNIPVIMVENEKTNLIDTERYRKMGVSTVHHVNTLYGKLSLVSLLYGNKGNFGYTDRYDGVLPEELFPAKYIYEAIIEDSEGSTDNGSENQLE